MSKRKTQADFEKELLENRNGEYKVIGQYTKLSNKISAEMIGKVSLNNTDKN